MEKLIIKAFLFALLVLGSTIVCARVDRQLPIDKSPPAQVQVTPNVEETSSVSEPPDREPAEIIPNQGPMSLVTISNAIVRDAVCNDGSPAVYYLRLGVGEGSRNWIIHLQGGGFCFSKDMCEKRTNQEPELMTADRSRHSRPGNGILEPLSSSNPNFLNNTPKCPTKK